MSNLPIQSQSASSRHFFSDEVLNLFHGFRVTGTCLDGLFNRAEMSFPIESILPKHIWQTIVHYSTPKSLFTLLMTAKGWSVAFDLNQMRNQHILLESGKARKLFLERLNFWNFLTIPFIRIESSKYFLLQECMSIYKVGQNDIFFSNIKVLSQDLSLFLDRVPSSSLTYLENLNLMCTDITASNLLELLPKCPNLTELNLHLCQHLYEGDLSKLKANCLPHLVRLNLSISSITTDNLCALLLAAPNLRNINLQACKKIDPDKFSQIPPGSLPYLEEIEHFVLREVAVNMHHLRHWLLAAPNVKKVDCYGLYDARSEISQLEGCSLLSLEKIRLGDSEVVLSDLSALGKAAPNLKKLDLSQCQLNEYIGLSGLEIGLFGSLEKLDLRKSGMRASDIAVFGRAAPRLRELSLRECSYIERTQISQFEPGTFQSLEAIDLSRGLSLDTSDICFLLKEASHLKDLLLMEAIISTGGIVYPFDPGSLPSLEKMNLANVQFASDGEEFLIKQIHEILKAAQNLKLLNLSGINFNDKGSLSKLFSTPLPSLEVMILSSVQGITRSDITNLIQAAPLLKKINLAWCHYIWEDAANFIPEHIEIVRL